MSNNKYSINYSYFFSITLAQSARHDFISELPFFHCLCKCVYTYKSRHITETLTHPVYSAVSSLSNEQIYSLRGNLLGFFPSWSDFCFVLFFFSISYTSFKIIYLFLNTFWIFSNTFLNYSYLGFRLSLHHQYFLPASFSVIHIWFDIIYCTISGGFSGCTYESILVWNRNKHLTYSQNRATLKQTPLKCLWV